MLIGQQDVLETGLVAQPQEGPSLVTVGRCSLRGPQGSSVPALSFKEKDPQSKEDLDPTQPGRERGSLTVLLCERELASLPSVSLT